MKRLAFLAVVIGLALYTRSSIAADLPTGVQLLEECQLATKETADLTASDLTASKVGKLAHCLGYLNGVADSYKLWSVNYKFIKGSVPPPACLPDDVTTFELASVVVKYLNDHPNKLHGYYFQLVAEALQDAYPCRGR